MVKILQATIWKHETQTWSFWQFMHDPLCKDTVLCSLPRLNREKRSTRSDLLIASEISYIKQNQKVL
jgi:hypothetical protein